MKITKEMTRAAYLASKNVFSGRMSRQEAIDHLSTEFGLARGSSGDFITNFRHMVHGRKYTRTLNNYSTDYFLKKIREDFELTIYQNALQAGYLHVEYYASIPKGGNLRGIQKILDIHSEKIKSLSQDIYISDSGGYGYQNTIIRTGINIDLPDAPENKRKTKTINGQTIYPRNPSYAKKSLSDANFLCEISSDHKTFTHKSSKVNFTEAHHLIPLKFHSEFEVSLDIPANIISLCPNCHKKLHFGQFDTIKPFLIKLLEKRTGRLQLCEIEINNENINRYYR